MGTRVTYMSHGLFSRAGVLDNCVDISQILPSDPFPARSFLQLLIDRLLHLVCAVQNIIVRLCSSASTDVDRI